MIEEQFKPVQLRPDVELVAEMNKEYTLKSRIRRQQGLILFGINCVDWSCIRVKIKSEVILKAIETPEDSVRYNISHDSHPLLSVKPKSSKFITKHTAAFDPELIYVYAINEKNAVKKVKRDFYAFLERQTERGKR